MRYRHVAGRTEGVPAISFSPVTFMPDPEFPMPRRKSSPEKIIMVGPCRVSIFRNVCFKDGKEIEIPKVLMEVRYKDKCGKWKGTHSMSLREIPKAILVLEKAFEYLTAQNVHEH